MSWRFVIKKKAAIFFMLAIPFCPILSTAQEGGENFTEEAWRLWRELDDAEEQVVRLGRGERPSYEVSETMDAARKRVDDLKKLQTHWGAVKDAYRRMAEIEEGIDILKDNIAEIEEHLEEARNSSAYNSEIESVRKMEREREKGYESYRVGFLSEQKSAEGRLQEEKHRLYREYHPLQAMVEEGKDLDEITGEQIREELNTFQEKVERIERVLVNLSRADYEAGHRRGGSGKLGSEGSGDSGEQKNEHNNEETDDSYQEGGVQEEEGRGGEEYAILGDQPDGESSDKEKGLKAKENNRTSDRELKIRAVEILVLTLIKGGLETTRKDLEKVDEAIRQLDRELIKGSETATMGELRKLEELKSKRAKFAKEVKKARELLRQQGVKEGAKEKRKEKTSMMPIPLDDQMHLAMAAETDRSNRRWLHEALRRGLFHPAPPRGYVIITHESAGTTGRSSGSGPLLNKWWELLEKQK